MLLLGLSLMAFLGAEKVTMIFLSSRFQIVQRKNGEDR